jgi:hypothetical protein
MKIRIDKLLDRSDYLHIDLAVSLMPAGHEFRDAKFKVFTNSDACGLEFRAGGGWPQMFSDWPGQTADAYGPVFRLSTGAALRGNLQRLRDVDLAFMHMLVMALPTIVETASREAAHPPDVSGRIAAAAAEFSAAFKATAETLGSNDHAVPLASLDAGSGPSDLFILGCGRSGTSLTAGLFRDAGVFMGERLHPPRPSNPTGYFEDVAVNRLNDAIIGRLLPARAGSAPSGYGFDIPEGPHSWLARLPLSARGMLTAGELETMRALTVTKPFCLKDPRFCYTLDLWRPFANRPKFICVFREPEAFVGSVFTECLTTPYLHRFAISVAQLFDVWICMYRHVLERHSAVGDWVFVEYADLLDGRDIERLEAFTGLCVDRSFVDPTLDRAKPSPSAPAAAREILAQLRARKAA